MLQRDLVAEADQPVWQDTLGVTERELARDLLARVEHGGLGDLANEYNRQLQAHLGLAPVAARDARDRLSLGLGVTRRR